jgi:hypothetical protein
LALGKPIKMVYNRDAKAVADKLKPLGLTPKPDPNGLKLVGAQIAGALTELEKSTAKSGPGANNTLDIAYTNFRPEVGPEHRNKAVGALMEMWTEARGLGAFDESHQYTGKITRGPDAGKEVVLEYIVPMSLAPRFSKDVVNIRLVAPSKARPENAPVTAREVSYQKALDAIAKEADGIKALAAQTKKVVTDAAGETKEQAQAKWKGEMKADGAATEEKPDVIVKGSMVSTPTKKNGNAWHVEADLTNLSNHATEVELETLVIGTTWKKHENYLMLDKKEKVQLRSGQNLKVPAVTLAESTYKARSDIYENLDKKKEVPHSNVKYRGTIWRVTHPKGEVGTFATDTAMLDMLKSDNSRFVDNMQKMFLDPKEWGKPTTSPGAGKVK